VILGCVGIVLWGALGWLTVRRLAPSLSRSLELRVVAGVVGLGLGLGAASWSLFLTGLLFDSIGGVPALVELAALSAGLLWLRARGRRCNGWPGAASQVLSAGRGVVLGTGGRPARCCAGRRPLAGPRDRGRAPRNLGRLGHLERARALLLPRRSRLDERLHQLTRPPRLSVAAAAHGGAVLVLRRFGDDRRSTPREQGLREIRSFLLGALPATAIITAFKLGWAQPNAFVEGQGVAETSARLLDGSRYATIAQRMLHEFLQVGRSYVWLLLVWALALGWRRRGRGTAAALLALVVVAVGYFFVYVATHLELTWHLATSCRRILTTLWPSLVFVFFAGSASVEEALRRTAPSREGTRREKQL